MTRDISPDPRCDPVRAMNRAETLARQLRERRAAYAAGDLRNTSTKLFDLAAGALDAQREALAALTRELEEARELAQRMLSCSREELEREVVNVLPPSHGIHGGPLVGLKAIYEDGTDENTARHRGWVSHEAVARLRGMLLSRTVSDEEAK